ncbi:hypothetical protein NL676_024232 [Syzygium grande]|nr:hypothetical protein NL676_024232 [Syzygium grande]
MPNSHANRPDPIKLRTGCRLSWSTQLSKNSIAQETQLAAAATALGDLERAVLEHPHLLLLAPPRHVIQTFPLPTAILILSGDILSCSSPSRHRCGSVMKKLPGFASGKGGSRESPWWYLVWKKINEAVKLMTAIAKANKKHLPSGVILAFNEKTNENSNNIRSYKDQMDTKDVITVGYNGISLNVINLHPNFYLNVFLNGVAEMPAFMMPAVLLDKFRRKPLVIGTEWFSRFFCLIGSLMMLHGIWKVALYICFLHSLHVLPCEVLPFISESPWWYLLWEKINEAVKLMTAIAKANKKHLPSGVILAFNEKTNENSNNIRSYKDQMDTKDVITVGYNGISLNVINLHPNFYLNVFLNGVAEMPAFMVPAVLLDNFGRKPLVVGTEWFSRFFCLIGSLTMLHGIWKVAAQMVAILGGSFPIAVFVVFAILGGILAFYLSETVNQPPYDTMAGMEAGESASTRAGTIGNLSDSSLGRKGSLTVVCILNAIFSCLTLSLDYWTYCLLCFITGFSTGGVGLCAFVLSNEPTGPKKRRAARISTFYFFSCGITPLWHRFCVSLVAGSLHLLPPFPPCSSLRRSSLSSQSPHGDGHKGCDNRSLIDVVKSPITLIRLFLSMAINFLCSVGYNGISLNVINLHPNFYLNVFLNGVAEMPASMMPAVLLDKFGRKPLVIGTEWFSRFFCLIGSLMMLHGIWKVVRMVSGGANGCDFRRQLPNCGLCGFAILGGILAFYLSETVNQPPYDTMAGMEAGESASTSV